jgi:hypothetical protein
MTTETVEGLDEGTHVVGGEQARKPLEWMEEEDDQWHAENSAGIMFLGGDGTDRIARWYVEPDITDSRCELWVVSCEHVLGDYPNKFASKGEAKAFCEARDLELWQKVNPTAQEPTSAPAPNPEPFDIVRAVEKYIADAIEHAEAEEDVQTAKVIQLSRAVARLNIALLRMDQGKKQVKERLDQAIEDLDAHERDAAQEAKRKKDEPLLPGFNIDVAAINDACGRNYAPAPEPWRATFLSSLPFASSMKTALTDAGLTTLGQLTDWLGDGKKRLSDLPGIGPAKVEAAENVLSQFWASHPEWCGKLVSDGTLAQQAASDAEALARCAANDERRKGKMQEAGAA